MEEFVYNPNENIKAVERQEQSTFDDIFPPLETTPFTPVPDDLPEEDAAAVQQARKLDDDDELSLWFDVPKQAVGGLRDAANAIKDLPIDMGEYVAKLISDEAGDQLHEANAQKLRDATDLPEVDESNRSSLNFGRKVVQFLAPFSALSKVNKAKNATRTAQYATTMMNGALADLAAFDSSDERLADMLEDTFGLKNWLAGDEDDSAMELRVKTMLEGAGLGLAFDAALKGIRFTRDVIRGKSAAKVAKEAAIKSKQMVTQAKEQLDMLADGRKVKVDTDFRPDKEIVDIETQRRTAEALGTTLEDVKQNRLFSDGSLTKTRNKLNSYTLVEEQAFEGFQNEAAEHYFRVQNGDKTARKDFVDSLFEVMEIHGKVQDATQEIARAQGFRGNVGAVQDLNTIRDLLSRSKEHEIDELMNAIGGAKDKSELRAMMKNIRNGDVDVSQTTLRELTERWFMNSILSSPVTLVSDTVSNVTFTAWNKVIEKPTAAAIGGLRSMLGGNVADRVRLQESAVFFDQLFKDTVDGIRLMGRGRKAIGEAIEGQKIENFSRFGKRSRKAFLTPERMEKIPPQLQGPAQFMANVANFPTHFMQTKDDVVKGMLYRSAVRERATRAALNEGLEMGSSEFLARVNQLQISPISDVANNMKSFSSKGAAEYDAAVKALGMDEANLRLDVQRGSVSESRKLTFTDEPTKVSEGINLVADNIPGGRFIVPFVTTIDNLTRRGLDRSPIALLNPKVRKLITSGTAEGDEALARLITGTGFMYTMYNFALDGRVTGDGPANRQDRDAALQVGFRPRSFLVGDEYIDFSRMIGPMALMFQIPANIAEIAKHRDGDMDGDLERDITEYLLVGAQAFMKTVLSQSWARGISDLFDSINSEDPKATKRMLQNLGSSLAVPNAVTFAANEFNPLLQEADTIWERIKVKAGADVRPKRDIFGDKIKRDDYVSVFLPANKSNPKSIPEWKVKLFNAGAFPSKPSRRITLGPEAGLAKSISGIELTGEQYERMLEIVGTEPVVGDLTFKGWLKEIVNSEVWDMLPDVKKVDGSGASKAEFVTQTYNEALKMAKNKLVQEYPDLVERAYTKGIIERTTPAMSPLMQTIGEQVERVRNSN